MAISSDYPRPITVNGYVCRNCDDVSKAKKFEDPSAKAAAAAPISADAVLFGGTLAGQRTVAVVVSTQAPRPTSDRYA
jgi:hypothetical protein